MLGLSRWQIFKTSAAAVLTVGTTSLLLIYFIPAPPSTVTMATGFSLLLPATFTNQDRR
jgi:hypothetical protein